ncbi:hypothetical protein [Streptomyces sp. NPDC091371]|uniref:hypothetical protein n=1 Tax=Streptomyces sp. NPDC091371 TaxID=3155303 RepID=UPI00343892E9
MLTHIANGDSHLSLWLRVREFAVPPSMIETATVRRRAGDWAAACAAAGFEVDLDLRSAARAHGRELAARVRADLRHLAPDLLRWHMPRIAPHGLLRPGLTITLARYEVPGRDGGHPVHLVARTAPAWADAGQRISLALWDGSHTGDPGRRHPHGRPNRRFRLDLHRHLWDSRRAGELRIRSGADRPPADPPPADAPGHPVERWAAEAARVLHAEGRAGGAVTVRLGARDRLRLDLAADADGPGPPVPRIAQVPQDADVSALPVLPDAATWELPDLELVRAGLIGADRLHPLVAAALLPERAPADRPRSADPARQAHLVECRGARHRIGLVDGVLAALDHGPEELGREALLVALGGPPLPCLQAIDTAHRDPDCLPGVRERLHHGDVAGALAVVEGLLGPDAVLRSGALKDALEAAARRRITYGLFRAGLFGPGPERLPPRRRRPPDHRSRPRHTTAR